jgi:hypothetical protein
MQVEQSPNIMERKLLIYRYTVAGSQTDRARGFFHLLLNTTNKHVQYRDKF